MEVLFAEKLRFFREKKGLSQNALAKIAEINTSYLNRLESGKREPPKKEIIMRLSEGMGLTDQEQDELLMEAGHLPMAIDKFWLDDPTIKQVLSVLQNESLKQNDIKEFRQVIDLIVRKWKGS